MKLDCSTCGFSAMTATPTAATDSEETFRLLVERLGFTVRCVPPNGGVTWTVVEIEDRLRFQRGGFGYANRPSDFWRQVVACIMWGPAGSGPPYRLIDFEQR